MTPRRVAIGCGSALVLLLLVAGCGLVSVYSQLPAGEHPDVDFEAAEIDAARTAKAAQLATALDGVERRYGAPHLGERGRMDVCEKGEDNFTREDFFAYSCRLTLVQVMPVAGPFAVSASRLGEALVAGTCPGGTETDAALARPYDDVQDIDPSRGSCRSASFVSSPEIRGWLPADPAPAQLERAEFALPPTCWPWHPREYCHEDLVDLAAIAAFAPPDAEFLAIVAAQEAYYLIPWECPWPSSWFRESCRAEREVR